MYDNLTADDIIDVWSRVHLDSSIEWARWEDRVKPGPPPLSFHFRLHLELAMADRAKRPFSQIIYGAA